MFFKGVIQWCSFIVQCTQPSYNDKNPSSVFILISLYVFPQIEPFQEATSPSLS